MILGLYAAIVHLLYWPSYGAGMVTDFSGLIQKLDQGTAWDILNSFGFPSVQIFLNFVYYLHYSLFGLKPLPWYLLYTSLFILNAWLLFLWIHALGRLWSISSNFQLALWSGIVFIVLPYQSEVVVWKVALSYQLTGCLSLWLLITLTKWIETPTLARWWRIQILFILSLLTFELSYSLPFFALLLFISLRQKDNSRMSSKEFVRKMWLPLLGLLAAYFLLTRLVIGSWIGHYGASVHLGADPVYTVSNFYRYFFKYLFLGRYLGADLQSVFFERIYVLPYFVLLVLLSSLTIAGLIIRYKKWRAPFQLSLVFLGLFVLALVPVVSLYFNHLLFIENDRYGFLASAFFAAGLISFLYGLPKLLRWSLLTLYLSACLYFTWTTNQYWQDSNKVFRRLLSDFNYSEYDHVFILNLPDNLQGADLFRDYSGQDLAFKDALTYVGQKEVNTQIHEIVQYNLTSLNDKVAVEKIDSLTFKVTFQQYGNWWWRRGIGASNYENEWYRFENQGMSYVLKMKEVPENSVFILQDGATWKELDIGD